MQPFSPYNFLIMPPDDLHIINDAARRDRDGWAQLAMEQHQYIRQLEQQIQQLQQELQRYNRAEEEASSLPQENDYQTLARWLEAEKKLGNDYYAEAGFNRSKMCRELRKILGWEPDQNSLRKAQNNLQT